MRTPTSPDEVLLSQRLRQLAEPLWKAQHTHPFVRGIGDGTLDIARFQRWIRQDYLYLVEYARLLALAAARAPDLPTMTRMAALLHSTLATEMALHREYAISFGISLEQMEHETAAPATRAYTDFLLRTATLGDYLELVAALLPCMWSFAEIGENLASGPGGHSNRYASWIDMYASTEFQDLAEWCRELLDQLATGASPATFAAAERAFLLSSEHELAFWQMAWEI